MGPCQNHAFEADPAVRDVVREQTLEKIAPAAEADAKPVVYYEDANFFDDYDGNKRALVVALNHPYWPPRTLLRTSRVLDITATGFETLNTRYALWTEAPAPEVPQ